MALKSRTARMLGIEVARPPTPLKPAVRQAPQPTAAARRAKAEPAPAKLTEPNTVRVIVVDPKARTVKEARLATEPGNPQNGFGPQLNRDAVRDLTGSSDFDQFDMAHAGEAVIAATGEDRDRQFWRYDDEAPISGVGIIVAYDAEADAYADTRLDLAKVREAIKWGADDESAENRAAIVAQLEDLDGQQLRRLKALIDDGALDEEQTHP